MEFVPSASDTRMKTYHLVINSVPPSITNTNLGIIYRTESDDIAKEIALQYSDF